MLNSKTFTRKNAEELSGKHIVIPDGYTKIETRGVGFFNRGIESVTIPASVEMIEPDSFGGLYDLKTINVDKNNTSFCVINGILFSKDGKTLVRCPPKMGLEVYSMPDDITIIESGAFNHCEELCEIVLPKNLKKICSCAFYNCVSLKQIDIPAGVSEIGNLAFSMCKNLERITIPESVSINGKVFLFCHSLENFTVIKASRRRNRICTIDGVLFSNDKTVLIDYPTGNKRSSYTIPDGVCEIMPGTFEAAFNLVEIIIPESVVKIGHNAFNNCAELENVNIPHGVTDIEHYAFYSCRALKNITIPHGVTRIGYQAFSSCDGLKTVEIPDTVTSIEPGAFSCCFGLSDITIPESVTNIGFRILSSMNPFTVRCKKDSQAHKYAVENDLEFELM